MTPRLRNRQTGLTLLGLIFTGIVIVLVAMVGMRVLPTVTEYMAIKRAVTKARDAGPDPQAIRAAFDRFAAVDDITAISGKDLDIQRTAAGPVVGFRYEKRLPLFGPAYLLLEYEGDTRR
ncbi:MAG TPA: DUF4845 domain-containing protein [Burkholderiaceae bacterium]|nr:DUF4845 domain-containing protein [Burkholderiaceae bacterium]